MKPGAHKGLSDESKSLCVSSRLVKPNLQSQAAKTTFWRLCALFSQRTDNNISTEKQTLCRAESLEESVEKDCLGQRGDNAPEGSITYQTKTSEKKSGYRKPCQKPLDSSEGVSEVTYVGLG